MARAKRPPQKANPPQPTRLQDERTVREEGMISLTQTMQQWSGPLPPPAALEAFERAVPGAGQLIITEFQTEAAHRRALERQQGNMIVRETHIGQLLAIVFGLSCLGVAAYAAFVGAQWIGTIIGGGAIVSGMVVFVGKRPSTDPTPQEKPKK